MPASPVERPAFDRLPKKEAFAAGAAATAAPVAAGVLDAQAPMLVTTNSAAIRCGATTRIGMLQTDQPRPPRTEKYFLQQEWGSALGIKVLWSADRCDAPAKLRR
jgi:hypothetical protein